MVVDRPDREFHKELALLLGAPSPRTEHVLEHHGALDAEPVRNGANTVGAEGASKSSSASETALIGPNSLGVLDVCLSLSVDIGDLAARTALILRELGGDTERMAQLGLRL